MTLKCIKFKYNDVRTDTFLTSYDVGNIHMDYTIFLKKLANQMLYYNQN